MIDVQKLSAYELYSPVDENEIKTVEEEMELILPNAYKQLLQHTNGFVTENGVIIFGVDIINERNTTYEVREYAKGYVAVGSNGGGKFLLMAANENETELIQIDSGVMDPTYATVVSENFVQWINDGAIDVEFIDEKQEIHKEKLCNLILISPPVGGAMDLKKIQEVFNIKKGLFDLLKGSKQSPFLLMKGIPVELALKNIKQLGEIVPPNLLPIGIDPADSLICLGIDGDGKIYFCDMDYFEEDNELKDEYVQLVSESFMMFLNNLYIS